LLLRVLRLDERARGWPAWEASSRPAGQGAYSSKASSTVFGGGPPRQDDGLPVVPAGVLLRRRDGRASLRRVIAAERDGGLGQRSRDPVSSVARGQRDPHHPGGGSKAPDARAGLSAGALPVREVRSCAYQRRPRTWWACPHQRNEAWIEDGRWHGALPGVPIRRRPRVAGEVVRHESQPRDEEGEALIAAGRHSGRPAPDQPASGCGEPARGVVAGVNRAGTTAW